MQCVFTQTRLSGTWKTFRVEAENSRQNSLFQWGSSGQIGHVATLYRFGSLSMPLLPSVVLDKLLLPSFPGWSFFAVRSIKLMHTQSTMEVPDIHKAGNYCCSGLRARRRRTPIKAPQNSLSLVKYAQFEYRNTGIRAEYK